MNTTLKFSCVAVIGTLIAVTVSRLNISDYLSGIILGADIVIMLYALYQIISNATASKNQAESQENKN